jgi:hypothetical protein
MRSIREQPRLVAARTLVGICLVLIGLAVGAATTGGSDHSAQATQRRVAVERSLAATRGELREANAHLAGARLALDHLRQRVSSVERTNRSLDRSLRAARRFTRRAKHHR